MVDFACNDFPTRNDHNHIDEGRQNDEPQRDAVYTQVVVHIETFNPRSFFDKLHVSGIEFETRIQRQRDQKTHNGADQRQPAHSLRLFITAQGQQNNAERNRRPNGKAQHSHFVNPYLLSQTKYVMSKKIPKIMTKA